MIFESTDERIHDFKSLWEYIATPEAKHLVTENDNLMNYLISGGFFTAPASTKYHGAYPGGLYDHQRCVFNRLSNLTYDNNLQWDRTESPFIVGFFHDMCKCDQYKVKDDIEQLRNNYPEYAKDIKNEYEYNNKTLLKGHGSKSVMILSQFINLTEEEMLCIRYHMGPYETDEWDEYDRAIRKYPNVLWTHHADMLAAKVDDV